MNLSGRFDEAFQFASDLHRTQTRKSSGTPYISHLMAVAAIALGEADDAPGLVLFGCLVILGTVSLTVRTVLRSG